ncbi:uncharacterized protein [Drosophila kikkawai]|uniref:Uncharacterized protein isoform X2 n=1 Tax=Drosophila kikkawai TaxID=30033 RepID=A0A6P4ICH1_DROKI
MQQNTERDTFAQSSEERISTMVSPKCILLFLALYYFLDGVSAVTCDVEPANTSCIDCRIYPTHIECLSKLFAPVTTAAPLTVATTKRSRSRIGRIRGFFGNFITRMRNKSWF